MALASRGLRDMGSGPEALDVDQARVVRSQARRVHVRAGVLGLLTMLGSWLLF